MSLLEQLAKKDKLNVDFHNHLQTGSKFRKKPKNLREWLGNLFLEEGFSNLTEILDRVRKSPLDGVYITNPNILSLDTRYEDWTSQEQLQIARKAGYEIEQGQYYTFFKKDNKIKFLGKSWEVSATQGHILFSGVKRDKMFPKEKTLEETLKEADDNELKIADHGELRLKNQGGALAYSKNKEEDIKKFDALERNGNFYFPFSLADWRIIRSSKKYKKPLIVDSDGHHPKDIGKTYNIFNSKDLDYNSEKEFRDSINYNARKGNFDYRFKPIPPWRVFHHILMIGIYKLIDKIAEYRENKRIRY